MYLMHVGTGTGSDLANEEPYWSVRHAVIRRTSDLLPVAGCLVAAQSSSRLSRQTLLSLPFLPVVFDMKHGKPPQSSTLLIRTSSSF